MNDISLGRYDAATPARNVEETPDADGVYEEASSDVMKALVQGAGAGGAAVTRYAAQYYDGGTACDIGSQQMRSTDVRLYCGDDVSKSQSFIESVLVRFRNHGASSSRAGAPADARAARRAGAVHLHVHPQILHAGASPAARAHGRRRARVGAARPAAAAL